VVVPILLSVAFMTIIERKMLAAMQRRLGPTDVGLESIKNKEYCKLSNHSLASLPFTTGKRACQIGVKIVAQGKRYFQSLPTAKLGLAESNNSINSKTDIINVLYRDRTNHPFYRPTRKREP
jgi:hypothetical protein